MKKVLLTLTALSLTAIVGGCSNSSDYKSKDWEFSKVSKVEVKEATVDPEYLSDLLVEHGVETVEALNTKLAEVYNNSPEYQQGYVRFVNGTNKVLTYDSMHNRETTYFAREEDKGGYFVLIEEYLTCPVEEILLDMTCVYSVADDGSLLEVTHHYSTQAITIEYIVAE